MMRDIAMCQNAACRRRLWCLRYRAIPHDPQVYADFKPLAGAAQCANFVKIRPDDAITKEPT